MTPEVLGTYLGFEVPSTQRNFQRCAVSGRPVVAVYLLDLLLARYCAPREPCRSLDHSPRPGLSIREDRHAAVYIARP